MHNLEKRLVRIARLISNQGADSHSIQKIAIVIASVKLQKVANTVSWAKRELELAGMFDKDSDYSGALGKSILEVVEKFFSYGHSGGSAGISLAILNKLLRHEPLTSLGNPTETSEYEDVSDMAGYPLYQATRDGSVFSYDLGKTWVKMVEDLYEDRLDENTGNPPFTKDDPSYGKFMTWIRGRDVPLGDFEAGLAGPKDFRTSKESERI